MVKLRRITGWLIIPLLLLSACTALRPYGSAESAFERGLALFNQGKFDDATEFFERSTIEDPNYAEAYLYLGRSYLSARRWREAIQPLRTAYRLAPEATKEEVFNLLMDALFAAALGGLDSVREAERPRRAL